MLVLDIFICNSYTYTYLNDGLNKAIELCSRCICFAHVTAMNLTAEFFIGAVRTVVFAITEFLGQQTDAGVIGTHVMGEFTHQFLTVLFI